MYGLLERLGAKVLRQTTPADSLMSEVKGRVCARDYHVTRVISIWVVNNSLWVKVLKASFSGKNVPLVPF